MPDLRHALVLTAGLGTRLHPLTLVRAKPAIPVAGVPLIRRILSGLASQGIGHAVLNLHHLPETIAAVVGDGSDLGVSVRYSWEQPMVLGSAGGPRLALPLIAADMFAVVNGDTLTDVDLEAVCRAHRDGRALVTLALTPNREPARYGGLLLDGSGSVTGVVARGPGAEGSFHFVGVQIVHAAAFEAVPPGAFANSIGGVYARLMRDRPGTVRGYVSMPSFHDIGTIEDYLRTSRQLAPAPAAARVAIDPTARISDSILWDDIEIDEQAVVDRCIVTDRVRVRAGERHEGVILVASATGLQTFPLTANGLAASDGRTQ